MLKEKPRLNGEVILDNYLSLEKRLSKAKENRGLLLAK